MAHASALSSRASLFANNRDIDAGSSVVRRPYTQPARIGRRNSRAIAWVMKMRCLQAPSHHGPPQRRRRLRGSGEPVGAAATRPVVPYAVRPCWEREGVAQRAVPRESTSLEAKEPSWYKLCMGGADAYLHGCIKAKHLIPGDTQQSNMGAI